MKYNSECLLKSIECYHETEKVSHFFNFFRSIKLYINEVSKQYFSHNFHFTFK